MRRFIRHPSEIPMEYQIDDDDAPLRHEHLKDVGDGGLSFVSARALAPGSRLIIRVGAVEPDFSARACVAWCHRDGEHYLVGVAFTDSQDLFQMRMIEQLCHIEQYRTEVLANEGRQLDSEQAAREWIRKFAREFPEFDE